MQATTSGNIPRAEGGQSILGLPKHFHCQLKLALRYVNVKHVSVAFGEPWGKAWDAQLVLYGEKKERQRTLKPKH